MEDEPSNKNWKRFHAQRDVWLVIVNSKPKLPARAKAAATALYFHFNYLEFKKSGRLLAYPSLERFARFAGMDRKTVTEGVEDLEAAALLEIERRYRSGRRHDNHWYIAKAEVAESDWGRLRGLIGEKSPKCWGDGWTGLLDYFLNKNI